MIDAFVPKDFNKFQMSEVKSQIIKIGEKFMIVAYFDGLIEGGLDIGVINDWKFESITGNNIDAVQNATKINVVSELQLGHFLNARITLSLDGIDWSYVADYKALLDPTSITVNWKIVSFGVNIRQILVDRRANRRYYRYRDKQTFHQAQKIISENKF